MTDLQAVLTMGQAYAKCAEALRHLADTILQDGTHLTPESLAAQLHDQVDMLEGQVAIAQGQTPPPPRRRRPGMIEPIQSPEPPTPSAA